MNYIGILTEYEQILIGNRKEFSQTYLPRVQNSNDLRKVLRYITEGILHWTPQQTKTFLTPKVVERLHMKRLIKLIKFPPELDPETDLFYVACFMYPGQISFNKRQRVLLVYEKVLQGELIKFPKEFFLLGYAEYNIHVCIQYALNHYTCFHSMEELYAFFADKRKFNAFARKVRLLDAVQLLYECPLDLLHESLSPDARDEFLYHYYKYRYYLKYGGQPC
ncbi:MAG: hypothetical protein ACLUN4_13435 [Lachnospiraceae bacterium]